MKVAYAVKSIWAPRSCVGSNSLISFAPAPNEDTCKVLTFCLKMPFNWEVVMIFKFRFVLMFVSAIVFAFAMGPAHSKGKAKKKSAFRVACGKEVKRHCKKVKPGKGRLLKCVKKLKKHKKTKRCRKYLAKRKKRLKARTAKRNLVPAKPSVRALSVGTASRKPTATKAVPKDISTKTDAKPEPEPVSSNCNTASSCYTTNDCCPDSSATGARLKVLQEAKAMLDDHLKRRGSTCENEKNLYYPRQCSGFVIDAFYRAGMLDVSAMKHYDWNASYTKDYAKCGGGKYVQTPASSSNRSSASLSSGDWMPNINVSYMRDKYCSNRTGSAYSSEGGCAHPWFTRVTESQLKPGDLWVSSGHVGIIFDVKNKVMVHNAVSTGPTMDRWDSNYYKNVQKQIIFVRHHAL